MCHLCVTCVTGVICVSVSCTESERLCYIESSLCVLVCVLLDLTQSLGPLWNSYTNGDIGIQMGIDDNGIKITRPLLESVFDYWTEMVGKSALYVMCVCVCVSMHLLSECVLSESCSVLFLFYSFQYDSLSLTTSLAHTRTHALSLWDVF